MRYVDEFLSLKCAGDVINACAPISGKPAKEITEAMAVVKRLKRFALDNPMKVHLIDVCSGNGLAGVLAAHMLPFASVKCVDIKRRKRQWNLVHRFQYIEADIKKQSTWTSLFDSIPAGDKVVVSSVHCCSELANAIINECLFHTCNIAGVVIMPCCVGQIPSEVMRVFPAEMVKKAGHYVMWTASLAAELTGLGANVRVYEDTNVISPCNLVVVADNEEVRLCPK